MRRIMIIGPPGSGKSMLSKRLGKILRIKVYHLDSLFWNANWEKKTDGEMDRIQTRILSNPVWIIDGNYPAVSQQRFNKADTIIFLDFPRILCFYRVLKRKIGGWNHIGLAKGCDGKIDLNFLKYIWDFRKNQRETIYKSISLEDQNTQVIVLKNQSQINSYLRNLKRG